MSKLNSGLWYRRDTNKNIPAKSAIQPTSQVISLQCLSFRIWPKGNFFRVMILIQIRLLCIQRLNRVFQFSLRIRMKCF